MCDVHLLPCLQDSRLDIAGVKAHPWFNKPLPPKFAESLVELEEEQEGIDQAVAKGAFQSVDRDKVGVGI